MENIPYWRATATVAAAAAAVVVVVVVLAVVVRSSSSSNVLHWLSIITIIITSFISPITCSFSMRYILTKWCSCFFLCLFGFCFSLGFSFLFWSFVFTSILYRVYFNCPFSDFCQWHTPLYLTPTLERFRILPTTLPFLITATTPKLFQSTLPLFKSPLFRSRCFITPPFHCSDSECPKFLG